MTAISAPLSLTALANAAAIVIEGSVNGQHCPFVLDTGDAIGPVFNEADATRLGLPKGAPLGVSGAGGAAQVYETMADVALRGTVFPQEPGAIDPNLQGPSLIGLPWFIDKAQWLMIDFDSGEVVALLR